jgi:predicted nuclease with RNAse H fold
MSGRLYLGVDVAGAANTWAAALAPRGDGAELAWGPEVVELDAVLQLATGLLIKGALPVAGVAIDAQLTASLDDRTGFRIADVLLRARLPPGCQAWVQSINSLMAVPVRGQMLAEALAPHVGTVLETHPRACLAFGLGPAALPLIRAYKRSRKGRADPAAAPVLWDLWAEEFGITVPPAAPGWAPGDGAVDALVCATVAWLYHRDPDALERVGASYGARGRGPFYVVQPRRARGDVATEGAGLAAGRAGARSPMMAARMAPGTPTDRAGPPGGGVGIAAPPPGPVEADVVVPTDATRYADVRGRAVQCPGCRRDVLRRWPFGWDAHAAHACAGMAPAAPEARKAEYRVRFARLFRPRA